MVFVVSQRSSSVKGVEFLKFSVVGQDLMTVVNMVCGGRFRSVG